MNVDKLSHAEALKIIRAHQQSAPVQVVPIAEALGLRVQRATFPQGDISGLIRKEDGGYTIYVNKSHGLNRRRFTIAHEIAHFVLHRDAIGDGLVDDALYRSGLSSRMEAEANGLAADILMPWHLLVDEDLEENTVLEIAKKYQVSKAAMAIRLKVPVSAIA